MKRRSLLFLICCVGLCSAGVPEREPRVEVTKSGKVLVGDSFRVTVPANWLVYDARRKRFDKASEGSREAFMMSGAAAMSSKEPSLQFTANRSGDPSDPEYLVLTLTQSEADGMTVDDLSLPTNPEVETKYGFKSGREQIAGKTFEWYQYRVSGFPTGVMRTYQTIYKKNILGLAFMCHPSGEKNFERQITSILKTLKFR